MATEDRSRCADSAAITPTEQESVMGHRTTVRADEVKVGDLLVLPTCIANVTEIDSFNLASAVGDRVITTSNETHRWQVLRILTGYEGVARFPHESVEVVRA